MFMSPPNMMKFEDQSIYPETVENEVFLFFEELKSYWMYCHGGVMDVEKLLSEAFLLLATDENGAIVPY